jgi:hypothetical protein
VGCHATAAYYLLICSIPSLYALRDRCGCEDNASQRTLEKRIHELRIATH